MEIEKIAQILIYGIHAPLGGVALVAGGVALIAEKGKKVHKKSGVLFYYSMLISAIAAFIIAVMPNHISPFLFSVGIFSSYFLLGGYRSLRFKNPNDTNLKIDKIIASVMLVTGVIMIAYPIVLNKEINIVLLVFGLAGIGFGFRDLHLFRDKKKLKAKWLKLHIGKMTGGYIASVSAFFVVNQILPNLWNWFVPGIIGSGYITYWMVKLNKKKKPEANRV